MPCGLTRDQAILWRKPVADTIADIEARGIWDADTRVVRVEGKRHFVEQFDDGEWRENMLSMCNICGCPLTRMPGNVCAQCGEPQDA